MKKYLYQGQLCWINLTQAPYPFREKYYTDAEVENFHIQAAAKIAELDSRLEQVRSSPLATAQGIRSLEAYQADMRRAMEHWLTLKKGECVEISVQTKEGEWSHYKIVNLSELEPIQEVERLPGGRVLQQRLEI
jgi:hypothetical protein